MILLQRIVLAAIIFAAGVDTGMLLILHAMGR